jgi:hypothetical protein
LDGRWSTDESHSRPRGAGGANQGLGELKEMAANTVRHFPSARHSPRSGAMALLRLSRGGERTERRGDVVGRTRPFSTFISNATLTPGY